MEVILIISDKIAFYLQNASREEVPRLLLEFVAIKAYEENVLTSHQVMELLGFTCREELWGFFKKHNVRTNHIIEDL